jgi:hypothetical protein
VCLALLGVTHIGYLKDFAFSLESPGLSDGLLEQTPPAGHLILICIIVRHARRFPEHSLNALSTLR